MSFICGDSVLTPNYITQYCCFLNFIYLKLLKEHRNVYLSMFTVQQFDCDGCFWDPKSNLEMINADK